MEEEYQLTEDAGERTVHARNTWTTTKRSAVVRRAKKYAHLGNLGGASAVASAVAVATTMLSLSLLSRVSNSVHFGRGRSGGGCLFVPVGNAPWEAGGEAPEAFLEQIAPPQSTTSPLISQTLETMTQYAARATKILIRVKPNAGYILTGTLLGTLL